MTTLYQLSGAALLGTRRSRLEIKDLPSGLVLPPMSSEAELLAVAGTLSLFEQTGQLPQRFKHRNQTMPKENLPKIKPLAARHLSMMLEGVFSDLIPEFLRLTQETNQRLPEEFLPVMLERGKNMYSVREIIQPILGQTGLWLAEQNPAWAFALPLNWEAASRDWRSNVMLVRQAMIKQARAFSPTLGRELIESTWKSESPTDRTWILKSLRVGLSMDDEPFLETALDDRSHTVRKMAAELLSVLAKSRLSRRMFEVAQRVFNLGEVLEYHPAEITSQLSRDGLTQPNWADQERVRAMQIADFVGLVHLSFWPTSPEGFINAALASPWSAAYMTGLANAAERQQNITWAKALFVKTGYTATTLKLVALLKAQDVEELFQHFPEAQGSLVTMHPVPKCLSRWNMPWSEFMTSTWLRLLQRQVTDFPDIPADSSFEIITKYMARFCPRGLIAKAREILTKISQQGYSKMCLEPLLILEFRQNMLQALGVNLE
jgi:Family of unknown function (DUF5691)